MEELLLFLFGLQIPVKNNKIIKTINKAIILRDIEITMGDLK